MDTEKCNKITDRQFFEQLGDKHAISNVMKLKRYQEMKI
jgi:hypothetical protein